jgi:ribosome-associated toxin RatA of RatAB toxin-antitoxin module
MTTALRMRADPAVIFDLAATVEEWPRILPHYRAVRVLRDDGRQRLVRMAASRDGIPVRWTAVQQIYPAQRRITFRHVGGMTRGMDVAWTLTPEPDGVLVQIWHAFSPGWPLVPDRLLSLVVGRFFVENIARKTLGRIRALAEERSRASVLAR